MHIKYWIDRFLVFYEQLWRKRWLLLIALYNISVHSLAITCLILNQRYNLSIHATGSIAFSLGGLVVLIIHLLLFLRWHVRMRKMAEEEAKELWPECH
jgi:hypothetical protein